MAVVITAGAVDLDREGRDPAYVESIVKRSQKIVDKLELTDTVAAREVTTIIANRYFKLNDIYETRDTKVKLAKETLTGDAKQEAVKAAEAEKDCGTLPHSFRFPGRSFALFGCQADRCSERWHDLWCGNGNL